MVFFTGSNINAIDDVAYVCCLWTFSLFYLHVNKWHLRYCFENTLPDLNVCGSILAK